MKPSFSMAVILSVVRGKAGKLSTIFDLCVQIVILISIVGLAISTIPDLSPGTQMTLKAIEVFSLAFFTSEYFLRVFCAKRKHEYVFSFWGIIDFLSIAPTLLLSGLDTRALRALRMLRLLRILKLGKYNRALNRLFLALKDVLDEFLVFVFLVSLLFFVSASGIYYFENNAQPEIFSSIPASMWWAVATLTTVGYGDVYPVTVGGKFFTTIILILGLGIVAVPAGLIANAFQKAQKEEDSDE